MAGFSLITQSTLQKMATSIEAIGVFGRMLQNLTRVMKKMKGSYLADRILSEFAAFVFHCALHILTSLNPKKKEKKTTKVEKGRVNPCRLLY